MMFKEIDLVPYMESFYDGMMRFPNKELSEIIFEYTEELYKEHYVSESVVKDLSASIKKFFTKLMMSMNEFIKELQIKIEYTMREKHLKDRLKEMRKELEEKKLDGEKEVEIFDVWYYKNKYLQLNKNLQGYAKKFAKVKYTKTYQIDDDLKKFNGLIDEYSDIMENALKRTTTIKLKKAIDFVEDEMRGKSEVFKTLNDSMRQFQEMKSIADSMQAKLEVLGNDVIPKHIGFIQKIANGISSFVRRFVTKFVMTVVLIFG